VPCVTVSIMFLIPKDCWEIKQTAEKGRGVYAKKTIEKGVVIGDYLGVLVDNAEYDLKTDEKGLYLMYYTDRTSIYPDLTKTGPHLINHSCSPNSWIYKSKNHTLFFAIDTIKQGEEITISYLLSPKDELCSPCPHGCKCNSKVCTGSMHLSGKKYIIWQKFQDSQKIGARVPKIIYGETLKRLPSYPKIKHSNPIYKVISLLREV